MGKLDEIDMKILGSLYRDASVSIPKLSKDLGLNLSVTYSRIKRLTRRKIIKQFTIIVDEDKLGLPASAVVGINLDPKQRDQALAEMTKNWIRSGRFKRSLEGSTRSSRSGGRPSRRSTR